MNKNALYRKQLELLRYARKYIECMDLDSYSFCVRDGFLSLFYESQYILKPEFIELIPIEKLSMCCALIEDLRSVSAFGTDFIMTFRGKRDKQNVIDSIKEVEVTLVEQMKIHSYFTVFYSWENDLNEKENRYYIRDAIQKAIKELNKGSDIALKYDESTLNVPGSPDIFPTITRKIDDALIFIADVTPIGKIEENGKAVPNPNVMCELGYALSSLTDERVILIHNSKYGDLKELPFDLGLKRAIQYQFPNLNTKWKAEEFAENLKGRMRQIRDY